MRGVGNVERSDGEFDARMPLPEDERRLTSFDDRQRGQRTPLAQRSGKMPCVVLALDRPAEGETAVCQPGKGALEAVIDLPPPGVQDRRCDANALRDEPL